MTREDMKRRCLYLSQLEVASLQQALAEAGEEGLSSEDQLAIEQNETKQVVAQNKALQESLQEMIPLMREMMAKEFHSSKARLQALEAENESLKMRLMTITGKSVEPSSSKAYTQVEAENEDLKEENKKLKARADTAEDATRALIKRLGAVHTEQVAETVEATQATEEEALAHLNTNVPQMPTGSTVTPPAPRTGIRSSLHRIALATPVLGSVTRMSGSLLFGS